MLHSIINKGVKEHHDAEERKQINLLNITTFISFFSTSFFLILNLVQHNWLLLASNCLLLTFTVTIFFINQLKYYTPSIYVLIILLTLFFFFNAVLLHNNLQYGILLVMVFTILLLNHKAGRMLLLGMQIALFITFIYFQNRPALIPPLPLYRSCIAAFVFLFIFSCMLEYFKERLSQYHRSLTIANEQLKESNRIKERMLSILAHDFNAPVGNLITSLDLLDEQFLTPEQFNTTSGKLKVQLQVLTSSMKDVLNWSKMQIQGEAGNRVNVNIYKILEEVFVLFEAAVQEKGLKIQTRVGPAVTAFANEDHIKLILRNILSNAIKFSHNGGNIFINAELIADTIKLCIKDEGTGMTSTILNALQNEQLTFTSTPGTAKERGTGLGLMLVREFIQKNNGDLTITSEQGKGSTFCVILPYKAGNRK